MAWEVRRGLEGMRRVLSKGHFCPDLALIYHLVLCMAQHAF